MDDLTREAANTKKTDVKVPFTLLGYEVKYVAQQLFGLLDDDGAVSIDMKVWSDGSVIATFEDKNGLHIFRTEDLKNEDDSEPGV